MDEFDRKDDDIKKNLTDDGLDNVGTNLNELPGIVPDHTRDEEIASEITAFDDDSMIMDDHDAVARGHVSSTTGWIGLGLAILSFFMMPIILGMIGIIVGFIARKRGAEWLGNTAIAAGVVSIIVRLLIIPLF